ncbi:CHRD domain-containing protein [Fortiea sp. LEGE XX443]|uniref:CHRD domain-containing protein n=1 Tax=Fortiea sp. LEGE XX443 TaxID=1828611 RepID=UPI001882DA61|nr:CHRD domain-containing protein [Fortiea sp. LEGE XX443]MBE9004608.1 CHRD domain-containing protein [Fortiea sp. LEGE XX443]
MKLLLTGTVIGAAIIALNPLAANAAGFSFTSTLNGAQENPPISTPATGTATGTLTGDPGSWVFSYVVNYSGLQGVIAAPFAHIHVAPVGVNGPIVHDLDGANVPPIAGSTSGTITGDWRFDDISRPLTDVLAQQLINGNTYFNIHTSLFPAGELRGQIQSVPEPPTQLGLLALSAWGISWQFKRQKNKQKLPS